VRALIGIRKRVHPGESASFRQVEVPSFLTLNADHRTIGGSLVCLSVQSDTD
jgi:hypothetical protein